MLPTNRRLKKESFTKVLKEGVFVHSTNFYLKYSPVTAPKDPQKTSSPSLFSFVVPNKVKKTSVGRHLIKRRMSAVVEKLLTTIKPGFLAVFFAKKDVSTLPYSAIEQEITELVKKARIL